MNKYLIYVMATLFATITVSIASPDKEALIANEKAAWEAFKDKKPDDFKKLVSADVATVYSNGFRTMQQEVDMMPKMNMKSVTFGEFTVVSPDPETASITYTVKVEGTADGKDISGTYNAGSVWRMVNGEWHAVFHTDMKEEKAAKPAG